MKLVGFATGALFALASLAQAGTKVLEFTSADFRYDGGTTVQPIDGSLKLGELFAPTALLTFMLPKNFKKNSTAKLELVLTSAEIGCNYLILLNAVTRSRAGSLHYFYSTASGGGVVPVVAGPTPAPSAAYRVFKKVYTIKKPTEPAISGQKAGDIVAIQFIRPSGELEDSCANDLQILGARLVYTTP